MESQEIISFIVHAFLFWLVFRLGHISGRTNAEKSKNIVVPNLPLARPATIVIEEINGVYYAYDGNDFLAQATNPDDLGKRIANRYPNKYHHARIQIKA